MADGWPERQMSRETAHDARDRASERARCESAAVAPGAGRAMFTRGSCRIEDGNRKSREHAIDLRPALRREGVAPGSGSRIVDTYPAGATTG
ncbi:hypothetical protein WI29_30195 [Burkholderia ubonensis]|nr:hypothetical protein WI31_24035 [Burkholderia ubonensis]KUZ12121.1 hypothetical protein WI29_30195 [Burkholderia ubonensis]KUZ35449.1 hypothetical protein WI30_09940 [Burkholderia ubonensis]KUZ38973.1 hypothetical protein WI32_09975 [Burkholderia ubonensis]KUZ45436.1 hypothetical protein WI33_25705 [Burkholderia ubonensis]